MKFDLWFIFIVFILLCAVVYLFCTKHFYLENYAGISVPDTSNIASSELSNEEDFDINCSNADWMKTYQFGYYWRPLDEIV
jgi:hypothetical protein